MALHVTAWAARLFGSTGHLMYLPFDKDFRANESGRDNHIPLKLIGARPFWYIFVDFPTMDPGNPDYPHAVEVHDNDDFGTIEFGAHWSERAGTNEGYGRSQRRWESTAFAWCCSTAIGGRYCLSPAITTSMRDDQLRRIAFVANKSALYPLKGKRQENQVCGAASTSVGLFSQPCSLA